jgi:hypothetical protein
VLYCGSPLQQLLPTVALQQCGGRCCLLWQRSHVYPVPCILHHRSWLRTMCQLRSPHIVLAACLPSWQQHGRSWLHAERAHGTAGSTGCETSEACATLDAMVRTPHCDAELMRIAIATVPRSVSGGLDDVPAASGACVGDTSCGVVYCRQTHCPIHPRTPPCIHPHHTAPAIATFPCSTGVNCCAPLCRGGATAGACAVSWHTIIEVI